MKLNFKNGNEREKRCMVALCCCCKYMQLQLKYLKYFI